MNKAIKNALKTWYPKEHKLHSDPLHPVIKLAGEAGELLDLYGKHKFKPRFDWRNCKHCGIDRRFMDTQCIDIKMPCVPLVLDELGDWWYYCRILMYLTDRDYSERDFNTNPDKNVLVHLSWLNHYSSDLLQTYVNQEWIDEISLEYAYLHFLCILSILDINLDDLTEMNCQKLNSEVSNHGWKDAR